MREINLTKHNSELESERRQLNTRIAQLVEDSKDKQGLQHSLQKEKERADNLASNLSDCK